MGNSALILELRRKALNTLHESSEMFEKAIILLKEGKVKEAETMQEMARQKRNDSSWLMAKANLLEQDDLANRNVKIGPP